MPRPLVFVVFSYITGILLSCCLVYSTSVAFLGAAFLFALAGIGYLRAWRENFLVILLLFVMLGTIFGKIAIEKSETPLVEYAGHYVTVTGTVVQDPDIRPDKTYLVLKCREVQIGKEHKKISGLVRVRVPVGLGKIETAAHEQDANETNISAQINSNTSSTQSASYIRSAQGGFEGVSRCFSYGDVIKVNGLLNAPEPPGNPGAFDYQDYLLRQGIRVELYARNIVKLDSGSTIKPDVNPVTAAALSFKRILTGIIDTSFTPENAALLKGIMLGERGMIDRETKDTMVRIGTVHLTPLDFWDYMYGRK